MDVLMYVFENYLYEEPQQLPERSLLCDRLSEVGFADYQVESALEWLDQLIDQSTKSELNINLPDSLRLYSDLEQQYLNSECRGFLQYLENTGILDPICREQVISRALALADNNLTIDDLKWIVLMVLFIQPGQEAAFAWMESYLFDQVNVVNH